MFLIKTAIDTGAGANTSLMVRGNILFEINETMVLKILIFVFF